MFKVWGGGAMPQLIFGSPGRWCGAPAATRAASRAAPELSLELRAYPSPELPHELSCPPSCLLRGEPCSGSEAVVRGSSCPPWLQLPPELSPELPLELDTHVKDPGREYQTAK